MILLFHSVLLLLAAGSILARKSLARKVPGTSCDDPLWCQIPIPSRSHFGFAGQVEDKPRWELARVSAAKGDQVLLLKVLEQFPQYLDFLDGDAQFRKFHYLADFFIDKDNDLTPLASDHLIRTEKKGTKASKTRTLERSHDFYATKRAPIVKVGYFSISQTNSLFYGGPVLGKAVVSRAKLLEYWRNIRDMVKRPFIALDLQNEHWGLLSTEFPLRTANRERCCSPEETAAVYEFLNHNQTLMLVVNQHHNFSHPKIVTLPRGLPLQAPHSARLIWDTMRAIVQGRVPKDKLVSVPGSTSGFRALIADCVRRKFPAKDFTVGNASAGLWHQGTLAERRAHYTNLATARVGLALPGVGYDTYRLWELLTLGSMAVIERGVGLDRMVWKLPVLLVDDFAEVTPQLLRSAYVEALYRAQGGEFEFQRLRQSYWYSFLMNVSTTASVQTIVDAFPMTPEDTSFTRPAQAYQCGSGEGGGKGEVSRCGPGTKRTPAKYC